jgi:hypothetical protein
MNRSLLLLSTFSCAFFLVACNNSDTSAAHDVNATVSDTASPEAVSNNTGTALVDDYAPEGAAKGNYVNSAKLDGVELASSVNIQTLPEGFWAGVVSQEKTGVCDYEEGDENIVNLEYKNKKVALWFDPGYKPDITSDQYRKEDAEVTIDLEGVDLQGFTELRLDNVLIKPTLTFDEFKKLFPLSAARDSYNTDDAGDADALYGVAFGNLTQWQEPGGDMRRGITFHFKNGKLIKLSVAHPFDC